MKYIGRTRKSSRPCDGSMYVFLTVFLALIFLSLTFLAYSLRLFVLLGEIDRAFGMNGADIVTRIRIDRFMSLTETDPASIDSIVGLPPGESYRAELVAGFADSLAESLGCRLDRAPDLVIVKEDTDGRPVFVLTDFSIDYGESLGTVRAKLNVPVFLNGRLLGEHVRDLEYSFSLSYKNSEP